MTSSATISRHRHDCADLRRPQGNQPGLHSTRFPGGRAQCETSKGTIPAQYNVMFNSIFAGAYKTGGDLSSAASCTLNAVNSLTGLNIQNFIVVDFAGLVK